MSVYDLLANGYPQTFNPNKAQATMEELSSEYTAKGLDAFSADAIENQVMDEHYINKLVLADSVQQYAKQYPFILQRKIGILLRNRNNMSATLEREREDGHYIVFIDDVLSTATLDILGILIYWEMHHNNGDKVDECYGHLAYILDVLCMCSEKTEAAEKWREAFMKEICLFSQETVHLLGDLFLSMQAFVINHELAHLVLGHDRNSHELGRELEADKLAYEAICEKILDTQVILKNPGTTKDEIYHYPYTYLVAPMLFDIYQLIEYYRDKRNSDFPKLDYGNLSVRKDALMDVPDNYDINSHEGNLVYNSFLNSIDAFKEMCEANL